MMKTGKVGGMIVMTWLFTVMSFQVHAQDFKELRRQANKAIRQEHFSEAIPILERLITNDSLNPETLFNLGLALYNTGDYHGCVKYSTTGIKVDSTYAAHYFRRGVCYAQLQEYSNAIRDYTKAIELEKKSFTYFNRALSKWKSGDVEGGITDFTAVLAMDPKHEFGFYYRALCYLEVGDTLKASADLNNAIALKPKDPDIYDERAFLRFGNKDYTGAKTDYLKCVELDPTYTQAHLSLSEISLMNGEWLSAYQHASNAVKHARDADERAIGLLLRCVANKMMNKDTSSDETKFEIELKVLEEVSWDFDDLQNALKQQNVSNENSLYVDRLIQSYYGE